MTGAKFDIEKSDRTGDFGLWRIKICALLIQHGCEAALEVLPTDMKAQTKAELNKKAHSSVIFCLGNKVLREVTGETTVVRVWSKLETLYMIKSLANKLYLKKKLYTFYMPVGRKISEHIDEFNTIEALTLEDVMATLNSKEIKERSKAKGDDGSARLAQITRIYQRGGATSAGKARGVWQEKSREAQFCENYVLGKLHRVRFGVGTHYTGTDRLCSFRLMRSVSGGIIGGKGDFLSIVDDYSKMVWVYILRFNYKAFRKFKEWKQLVENQTGRTVKKLTTDNGLKFCNWKFQQLCIKSGSGRHFTVAETPQQNGLAERMNRTIIDKTIYDFSASADKSVESVMYKDTLKNSGAGADKSVEELQVEVELQRLNNHTPEKD
nr:retrovirus-related Pol polyprotein from transposon TNT 1-94 [Tanacetum cinerariifolium]